MRRLLSTVCFLGLLSSVGGPPSRFHDVRAAAQGHDTSLRIVSIGGAVTEIIYALGAGAQLVGVDTSSIYPEIATTLPQVGYQRMLSAEGVLSLTPSLVIATAEAGPPAAMRQLQAAGVNLVLVPNAYTVTGVHTKLRLIARALGREARGEELVQQLDHDLAKAREALRSVHSTPRVLFIYARGQGNMNVSGGDTSADAMIHLAGGTNAVTDYTGYKPLTAEAVAAVTPDVLLLPTRGLDSIGGIEGLLKLPGVSLTPAARHRRVVAMHDLYLLGFGPRLGQAVLDLVFLLHPELPRDAR